VPSPGGGQKRGRGGKSGKGLRGRRPDRFKRALSHAGIVRWSDGTFSTYHTRRAGRLAIRKREDEGARLLAPAGKARSLDKGQKLRGDQRPR
jgi:hypothetical protein